MVKFLHTADWQLGMNRHYLSAEAQPRFSAARLDAIERIGFLAMEEKCEFVIVSGDVFESNHVRRQVVVRAFERMAATPEVTFFLLPGNHDPLDASSVYFSSTFTKHQPDNVRVLDRSGPVEVVSGVELVPAPWPNKHPDADLVDAACQELEPSDAVRILVGHGAVDSMAPKPDDQKLIALEALEGRIESGLIQYVALGDRHSTTDVGGTGRVWYAGTPEPTDYTEIDPGQVLVVEFDADHINVATRHVGTWQFLHREWPLSGGEDIDALEEWLEGLSDKDRTIVKLSLVGQVSVAQKARLDNVLDHNGDLLAALETGKRQSDLAVLTDAADLDHFGLSGFALDALLDLREMAESGEEPAAARGALALLYRLARPRN